MRFEKGRAIPEQCVVSVHHSGTRSLVKHLGLQTHQHFVDYDRELGTYYADRGDLVHIPVRHPMAVAASWARKDKPVERLIGQFRSMFAFLERHGARPVLYCMEQLPRLAGLDDPGERDLGRESLYRLRIGQEVVEPHLDFYLGYYVDPFSTDTKVRHT